MKEVSAEKPRRRNVLLALLGGAAAFGAGRRASAQTSPMVPSGGTAAVSVTGLTIAASLSALANASSALGTVYLSASGRAGVFIWSGANHSVDVTNDPGQGEWAAPATDTSGASGAWVRQWSGTCDWAWWGAVADTVCSVDPSTNNTTVTSGTDNGTAFLNWQTWAQYKSSLGLGVYVEPNFGITGVYGWNVNTSGYYWVKGIQKLHINGRKIITMQQLLSGASGQASFPIASDVGVIAANSYLIQSTAIGATSFTCVTAAQAANFLKGNLHPAVEPVGRLRR